MPQFSITDSQTGRSMTVEGDAPPTDQDAADLFASLDAPPQMSQYNPTLTQKAGDLLHSIRTSGPVEALMGQTDEELAMNPPAEGAAPMKIHGVMGGFEEKNPLSEGIDKLTGVDPETNNSYENPKTALEGLHNWAASVVNSVASPLGIATSFAGGPGTPMLVKKALGIAFGAQGAALGYDSVKDLVTHAFKNNAATNVQDVGNTINALLMTAGGAHALKGAKPLETPVNGDVNPRNPTVDQPVEGALPPQGQQQVPSGTVDYQYSGQPTPEAATPQEPLPVYQQPDMGIEQVNSRLAEIDAQRKAGAFSGITREEARLLKRKQQLESEPPPAEQPAPEGQPAAQEGPPEAPQEELTPEAQALLETHKDAAGGAEIVTDDKLEKQVAPNPPKDIDEYNRIIAPMVRAAMRHSGPGFKEHNVLAKWYADTYGLSKYDAQKFAFDAEIAPETSPKNASMFYELQNKLKEKANPDDPFAAGRDAGVQARIDSGSPAFADKPNNRIVIATKNMNQWLSGIPVERRAQAVRSLLSEEQIHLATTNEDALAYAGTLSKPEKWAVRFKYGADDSDLNLAHEAVRQRMQQLMRVTPTEIAQEYGNPYGKNPLGLKRMSIQAVEAMEHVVRTIRHGLKRMSPEQQAILGRVDENLKAARIAASGGIVQTQDNPYSKQAADEAKQLQAQAQHYRSLGMTDEADEMQQMAQKMGGWSQAEAPPEAGKPADQGVIDALKSRTSFENTVGAAGRFSKDKLEEMGKRWNRGILEPESIDTPYGRLTPGNKGYYNRENLPAELKPDYDKIHDALRLDSEKFRKANGREQEKSPEEIEHETTATYLMLSAFEPKSSWSKSWVSPKTVDMMYNFLSEVEGTGFGKNDVLRQEANRSGRAFPGARGRGRPKQDKINPHGKENLFAPSAFAAGGDLQVEGGHALPEGQGSKLPTASEIEAGANKFLDKTISESLANLESGKALKVDKRFSKNKSTETPGFDDFAEYMKRNFKTQPGQVKDLYQRGLVSRLQAASGDTLSAMLKTVFGRDSILARMRVPDAEGAKESSLKPVGPQMMFPKDAMLDPIGDILHRAKHPGESKGISEGQTRQQTRQKAIGMIAKKLMAPMLEDDAGIIDRKSVTPGDIRYTSVEGGDASSYQELSKQDEHNPNLGEMLTDRNRRANSDRASISRRLTVMRDRKSGQVHMVSTWKNPATGRVFLTNPSLPKGEGLRLEEALHRYQPLRSILLDEPTEKFHKSFKDANDYESKFGREALENQQTDEAYEPEGIPVEEFESEAEGTEGVESSSFQGPERKMVEAATGAGRSSVEDSLKGRITKPEADAVSRAIAGADSPEAVRDILKGLGKEDFDKLKFEFHRATARLGKATEKFARAMEDYGIDVRESKEVDAVLENLHKEGEWDKERALKKVQAEVTTAQEDALKASRSFREEAAMRSGITKIAKRFQALYGKKWADTHDIEGKPQQVRVAAGGEELLGQMAKSLYNAHLTALSGRAPVDAIMELGGDKKKSAFDKTITPTGKDLSMRTPPSSRQYQERAMSNLAKIPPPKPEELSPAPPKPVEMLDGSQYQDIRQSVMSDERRQNIGANIVEFTPEEKQEMELEGAINSVRHDIFAEENRQDAIRQKQEAEAKAIADKNKPFALEGEQAAIKVKDTPPDPRVKTYPPRPIQPTLPIGSAGRRVQEAVNEQAERLAGMGAAWNKRSDIMRWISAGYDSFGTVAHNLARVVGNEIRTEATDKGKVNQQALGAAIAMRSANPFRKLFSYSPEALDAFEKEVVQHPDAQLSQVLLNQDAHGIKLYLHDLMEKETGKSKQAYYGKLVGDINSITGLDKAVRNEKGQTIRWKGQPETVPSSVRMEGIRIGKEAERMIENKLVEDGLLSHSDAQYKFDPSYKYKLDTFLTQIKIGRAKAAELAKSGNVLEKMKARAWMKDLDLHQKDVEYAKAHWGDKQLQETTLKSVKELDHQYDAERAAGTSLSYDDAYLPGRYSGQFHNNLSVVFGPVDILGRNYAAGKKFDDPYDATSTFERGQYGPYISATHDISNLVEHRIRQGAIKLGQKAWEGQLATIKDPATKQQAFATARYVDGNWVPELPVGADAANYETVSANASRAPMYALKGSYSRLLDNLVSPSKVDKWAFTKAAMQAGQFMKHVSLLGDFFHLNRITHYAASIMGKGAYKFGQAHTPGWAALDFREEGVDKAVERGVLTQKDADWLREKLPIKENGFKTTATRLEIAKKFEKSGFNVGQIQDAIYKDLVSHIPALGTYTKFLFDKYTRGLMMRSAIEEYTRLQSKNPEVESSVLMRGISRDLNNYFGSIGKQGWIKSATMQDLSRLFLLAPQWVEGIVKKDAGIPYKLGMAAKDGGIGGVVNLMKGNDTMARGITRGLVSMFVLSQVINMITRRQPTWDNEEGHKFDADIGGGAYINPLSVFNEMLHEFIHYNETKPTAWEAIRQIGENKLGFVGRAALTLLSNKGPTGELQTSTMGAVKTAAMQLLPIPITLQTAIRGGMNMASGGKIGDPVNQGDINKAAASLLGVKADIAPKVDFAMKQKAQQFVKANHLSQDMASPELTDQPSYAKLRHEVSIGNNGGAQQILEDLRQNGVKDRDMLGAMKTWLKAPFTGSRRNELLWLHSMSDDERQQYHQAVAMKYDTYKQFVDFYINHSK